MSDHIASECYEQFTANVHGRVRRETFNGQSYLVAPMTLLQAGHVLNGSQGPLLYPAEEVAKNPGVWNNIPITNGHPTDEQGNPTWARSPKILERYQLGHVFNDVWNGTSRDAEGWFNEAWTKERAPRVYKLLSEGKSFDLSTGLKTRNQPVRNGSHANGKAYSHVARDYVPDHLAALSDQQGACSRKDGCGVFVGNVCEECSGDPTDNAFCPTGEGGGQDNSCSAYTTKEVQDKEGYTVGHDVVDPSGKTVDFYDHESEAKEKASSLTAEATAKWISSPEGKKAIKNRDKKIKEIQDTVRDARRMGNLAEVKDLEKEITKLKSMNLRKFTSNEDQSVTNEDKRSLWRQLGDMLGITTTENAFCPTGKGGGQDNSCSSTEGGSDSSEVKGKPIPDSPYGIPQGQTVKFHDGEFKGYEVQLQGLIRKNLSRKEDDVHRGQIVGIKGGAGEITVSHSTLKKYATLTANQSTEGDAMPTPTNKEELVSYLTTNCSCHKGKEKVLNQFDEETLNAFKEQYEELKASQLVVNTLRETNPKLKDVALNEMPAAYAAVAKKPEASVCPECKGMGEDCTCKKEPMMTPVKNTLAPAEQRLTPEEIETLSYARKLINNSKAQLVELVVNALGKDDAARKAIRPLYERMSHEDLETVKKSLPPTRNAQPGKVDELMDFFGASGGSTVVNSQRAELDQDDVLEPTINWAAEEAKAAAKASGKA